MDAYTFWSGRPLFKHERAIPSTKTCFVVAILLHVQHFILIIVSSLVKTHSKHNPQNFYKTGLDGSATMAL